MALNAAELKAVSWYMRDNQLRPMPSTPPKMYFKDKNGNEVTQELTTIVSEYKAWNEQDKKERAREKRIEATRNVIRRGF